MELRSELAAICGADHVRDATPDDEIRGARPTVVAAPGSAEEVAAALRAIDTAGAAVCVAGAGAALAIGARPTSLDVVLRTARLDRIVEHSAGDLQIKTQAGVRLSEVQRRLAADRQRLALDPPHDGTLGGIVATAASGPLRHRYGGPRDLLLGVTLALADGTLAKAGGKVVKNVAGYDLGKLVTGSYGTLAVIVDVTLRLHHVPPASVTLRHPVRGGAKVAAVLDAYARAKVEPSALEVDLDLASGAGVLTALLEGTDGGVTARAEIIRGLLGDAEESDAETPAGRFEIAASLRPGGVPAFLDQLRETLGGAGVTGRVTGRAGVGALTLWLDMPPDSAAATLDAIRTLVAGHDGAAVVHSGPDDVALDIWGPVRGLGLMRRVKAQFDPNGRLAPGRFVGGI